MRLNNKKKSQSYFFVGYFLKNVLFFSLLMASFNSENLIAWMAAQHHPVTLEEICGHFGCSVQELENESRAGRYLRKSEAAVVLLTTSSVCRAKRLQVSEKCFFWRRWCKRRSERKRSICPRRRDLRSPSGPKWWKTEISFSASSSAKSS